MKKCKLLNYGERLKWARKRAGLTQLELAELSGVGQGTISKIERGDQSESSYDTILAHHLNVYAYWLTTGEGNPDITPLTTSESNLINAYRKAPDEVRSYLDFLSNQDK